MAVGLSEAPPRGVNLSTGTSGGESRLAYGMAKGRPVAGATLNGENGKREVPMGRNGKLEILGSDEGITERTIAATAERVRKKMDRLIAMQRDMEREKRGSFDALLNRTNRSELLVHFRNLTRFKPGLQGRGMEVNEDVLQDILCTKGGVVSMLNLLRTDVGQRGISQGAEVTMGPEDEPDVIIPQDFVLDDKRGGPIRRVGRAFNEWQRKPAHGAYGRHTRGWIIHTNRDALIATIATGVVPGLVVATWNRLNRPALSAVARPSAAALTVAQQASEDQREFDLRYTGINSGDFRIVGPGRNIEHQGVRVRTDVVSKTSVHRARRAMDMNADLHVIEMIQRDLGITDAELSATDVNWMIRRNTNRPQGVTDVEAKALQEFIDSRGPDYSVRPRDLPRNVWDYYKIKEKHACAEAVDIYAGVVDNRSTHLETAFSQIDTREQTLRNDPEEKRLRTETLAREKAATERARKPFSDGLQGMDTYAESVAGIRERILAIREGEGGEQSLVRRVAIEGNDNPSPEDIRAALAAALRPLPDDPAVRAAFLAGLPNITVDGQTFQSIPYARQEILESMGVADEYNAIVVPAENALAAAILAFANARSNAALTGVPITPIERTNFTNDIRDAQAAQQVALNEVNNLRTSRSADPVLIAELNDSNALRTLVTTLQSDLNNKIIERQEAERSLISDLTPGRRETLTVLRSMAEASRRVADMSPRHRVTGAVPAAYDLRPEAIQGMSFAELQERINNLHQFDLDRGRAAPRGWPASVNDEQSNVDVVNLALSQAKAGNREPSVRTPSGLFGYVLGPRWGLTEPDLFVLSAGEIRDRMTRIGGGGIPTEAALVDLKAEVTRRFEARRFYMQSAVDNFNSELEDITGQENELNEGISTPELNALRTAFESYIPNMESLRPNTLWEARESYDKFLDLTVAENEYGRPEYLPEEVGLVNAYLNALDKIFKYKSAGTVAQQRAAFRVAFRLLPPERLTEELRDYFGLTVVARPYDPVDGYDMAAPAVERTVANIDEAYYALRREMGLTVKTVDMPEGVARESEERTVSIESVANFYTEHILFSVLEPHIARADGRREYALAA